MNRADNLKHFIFSAIIFFLIPAALILYLICKPRKIESLIEKKGARRTVQYLLGMFLFIFLFAVISKFDNIFKFPPKSIFASLFNFLNKNDTFFTIAVGFLTVLGLLLAFLAIRGLFERIRSFKDLLEIINREVIGESEENTIKIMGYYLTFGIVTSGNTNSFKKYINSIKEKKLQVIVENTKQRQKSLESYCLKYGFKPEALKSIYGIIMKEPGEQCPYKRLLREESDFINIENIINKIDEKWSKKRAAFIFNVYNEYLLNKDNIDVKFLSEETMPDYHVCFSSLEVPGVIFIPLKIPEAVSTKNNYLNITESNLAEIIGWRTKDRSLLERLENNFKYYWNLDNAENREDSRVISRNKGIWSGDLYNMLIHLKNAK